MRHLVPYPYAYGLGGVEVRCRMDDVECGAEWIVSNAVCNALPLVIYPYDLMDCDWS